MSDSIGLEAARAPAAPWLGSLRREGSRTLLLAACVALLGGAVAYPFGAMLARGLADPKTGATTLDNIEALAVEATFREALLNTVGIAGGTLLLSLALALPLAWGVARTDMPGKRLVRSMTVLTFATPSFLGAIAWIILLGPRGGALNLALEDLLGLDAPPFDIFSRGGIVFVLSLYLYPYLFFAVAEALANMDEAVEEAASMLGAGPLRTALTVSLPLVTPAILAGGALVVLESVVIFGVPAVLGMPVHIDTLTTKIYALFSFFPPEYEKAAAGAIPIVAIVAGCVFVQRLAVGKRSFVTVGGNTQRQSRESGPIRWLFAIFALLLFVVSIVLPFLALLLTSVKATFGNPLGWDNLSAVHYLSVLGASTAQRAIGNSILLAGGAALVCMTLGGALALLVERTSIQGRGVVTFLVTACFSFPSIALAVALTLVFSSGPLEIAGTIWILLLAYSIQGLPVAFNYIRSALKQIRHDLTEAAEVLGADWARASRDVTLPLIRGSVIASGLVVFVVMIREFGSSVLLASSGTEVIAVTIYEYSEEGDNGKMAALAVMVYLVNLVVILGVERFARGGARQEGS